MKIVVGLSGGVDSSVAAALLKDQGHDVIGVTMKLWNGKYKGGSKDACFSPNEWQDIESAKSIANKLGIEHHVIDCSNEYDKTIIQYFKDSYANGQTPNPCVRCNAEFKFGLLPKLAEQKLGSFDKFATGHYARVLATNNNYVLCTAKCKAKDQTYFLSRLSQEQLAKIMFPLGDIESKEHVRDIARKHGLCTSEKPDSMDFYSGDINELIAKPDEIGKIIDMSGNVLGTHNGHWHFTIGQRHGLNIKSTMPMYVIDVKPCHNIVVAGTRDQALKTSFNIRNMHFIGESYKSKFLVDCKIRSNSKIRYCTTLDPSTGVVELVDPHNKEMFGVTPGQFAVFYSCDRVVGSGIIS